MSNPNGHQESEPQEATQILQPVKRDDRPSARPLVSAQGETCANCGSLVAADQRYCIDCGERRGEPRLPFMDGRTAAPAEPQPQPAFPPAGYYPPPAAPRGKWASGLALLSTIAVLLLAMGVGVLIGNRGDASPVAQQPLIVGGAGLPTDATGTAETNARAKKQSAASAADADGKTEAGIDANAIAKKNGVKLAKPDVDLGDKCEKGSVGCNDEGKFDGEYFK